MWKPREGRCQEGKKIEAKKCDLKSLLLSEFDH